MLPMRRPLAGGARRLASRRSLLSEIIGRTAPSLQVRVSINVSTDYTRPNYGFWSRYRRGLLEGHVFGSHFAQPVLDIMAAWALGNGLKVVTGNERLDEVAADLVADYSTLLATWMKDAAGLGDSYIMIDPADGRLKLISPDLVEVEVDPGNPDRITAITVTVVQAAGADGSAGLRTVDRWEPFMRTLTVGSDEPEFYPNFLGVIPIIPLSYGRESNEVYGHPIYAPLLEKWARYHDISSAAMTACG